MDEKSEILSRIIEEDYIERLKLMASYYGQFKESPNAKYNAEALQYAIDKLEYWLKESES